jgi:hypothetical protein
VSFPYLLLIPEVLRSNYDQILHYRLSMDITVVLPFVAIVVFVIWVWGGDIEDSLEIKRISKRDALRQDSYYHFKEIEALNKAGKIEQAKKLNEAPKDKKGNFCRLDQETGEWLQRGKNGTWVKYRP